MTIGVLLDWVGILASILAAISAIFLFSRYILGYRKKSKRLSSGGVGVSNLIIALGMALVAISSVLSPSHDILLSSATSIVIVLVGLFVVVQAAYLFVRRDLPSHRQTSQSKETSSLPDRHDEKAEYWSKVSKAIGDSEHVKDIQILGMRYSLPIDEMYIPQKVYDDGSPQDMDDHSLELYDPLSLLELEREKAELRIKYAARDPIEMIKLKRQCVLVGEQGIGKTTFLKYITRQVAQGHVYNFPKLIPIYISLKSFQSKASPDLLMEILDQCRKLYFLDLTIKGLEEILRKGEILLLLDGLDETMHNKSHQEAQSTYTDVRNAISDLASTYPKSYVIVTSRKSIYDQQGVELSKRNGNFDRLEFAGFLVDDIRTYIERRYTLLPARYRRDDLRPEAIVLALQQDLRLRELASVPLMLTLIATSYFGGGNISADRPELYEECAETLLCDWDKSRDIRRPVQFTLAQKRAMLMRLAWEIQHGNRPYLHETDALKYIMEIIEPDSGENTVEVAKPHLEEIINSSGLLMEYIKDSYCFSHLIMQEYFAAKYAKAKKEADGRQDQDINKELFSKLNSPWWENVLILYAAYTNQLPRWLDLLLDSSCEDIFHAGLLFAGRSIAARPKEKRSGVEVRVVESLKKTLSAATHQSEADKIVETLVGMADTEVNELLLQQYRTPGEKLYPSIGLSIAKCLPRWGDSKVSKQVVSWLFENRSDSSKIAIETRKYLAYALGALGERSIATELMKYLGPGRAEKSGMSDANLELRGWTTEEIPVLETVIKSLKRLGNPDVIENLCRILDHPPELVNPSELVESAQSYDQQLRSDKDVLKSRENLSRARDELLERIVETLGVLGRTTHNDAVNEPQLDKQRKLLIETLERIVKDAKGNSLSSACIASLHELGKSQGNADAVTTALQDLQIDASVKDNWEITSRIKVVLWTLGEKTEKLDIVALLSKSKQNPGETVRKELVTFLIQQKVYGLPQELIKLVNDTKVELTIRSEVAKALGVLGDKNVARGLLSYVTEWMRKRALSNHPSGKTEYADDVAVLTAVVASLGKLYNTGKVNQQELGQALKPLFKSDDSDLLLTCASVLDDIGEELEEDDREVLRNRFFSEVSKQSGLDPTPVQKAILGKLGFKDVRKDLIDFVCSYDDEKMQNAPLLQKGYFDRGRELNQVFMALYVLLRNDPLQSVEFRRLADSMFGSEQSVGVRVKIAELLGKVGKGEEICKYLVNKMDSPNRDDFPEVQDDIYRAVKLISDREGLHIYRKEGKPPVLESWDRLYERLWPVSSSSGRANL